MTRLAEVAEAVRAGVRIEDAAEELRDTEAQPQPVLVYVAGSSKEIDRVQVAQQAVVDAGASISFDWTAVVVANMRAGITDEMLPPAIKRRHARADLGGIERADVFWLLLPETPSIGAWVELGSALAAAKGHGRPVVVASGHGPRPLFAELCDAILHSDEDAAVWIRALVERAREA